MTTSEFLSHLRTLNVELWADGESLRCSAPKAVLTPELRRRVKRSQTGYSGFSACR